MIPRVTRLSTRLQARRLPSITQPRLRKLATTVQEDDGFAGANAFYVEQSELNGIRFSVVLTISQCTGIGRKVCCDSILSAAIQLTRTQTILLLMKAGMFTSTAWMESLQLLLPLPVVRSRSHQTKLSSILH